MSRSKTIKDFFKPSNPTVTHDGVPGSPRKLRLASPTLGSTSSGNLPEKIDHAKAIRSDESSPTGLGEGTETAASNSLAHPESKFPTVEAGTSFNSNISSALSSQRIIKNGEVMITNSDGESDTENSLEDIDELLRQPSTSTRRSTRQARANQAKTLTSNYGFSMRGPEGTATSRRKALFNAPKHKFSLDTLATRIEENKSVEAGVEQALLLVEDSDRRIETLEKGLESGNLAEGPNGKTLLSMMAGGRGEDSIDKVARAMERTEVLQSKKRWSFFAVDKLDHELPEFPNLSEAPLAEILNVKLNREAAFLSGFLDEVAAKISLPYDLLAWLVSVAPFEPRSDLRDAYYSILLTCKKEVTLLLHEDQLKNYFHKLGASEEAMGRDLVLEPVNISPYELVTSTRGWQTLKHVLELVSTLSASLSLEANSRALDLLCRLAADAAFETDAGLQLVLQDAISALLHALPTSILEQQMSKQIAHVLQCVRDTQLRLQLLENLAGPHRLIGLFRQRLALAIVHDGAIGSNRQHDPVIELKKISKNLRQPDFQVGPDTDFADLAASVGIMDIAIDNGGWIKSLDAKREKEFNEVVDRLSQNIQSVSKKIRDTGANHMARTEAKETLEALHARLQYAVRTKPKPKPSIFDEIDGESHVEEKLGMAKFVKGVKAR